MNLENVSLAYFLPTGTIQKILRAIAKGYGAKQVEQIDLTLPAADIQRKKENQEELMILGVPVYEGRVSKTAIPRLKQLTAKNTPAVVVVMYGNRDFEDALLELNDLALELSFLPVAGGAFIGEHSFAREDRPMANGRPDAQDIKAAMAFGSKIREKIKALDSVDKAALITPPGNTPYVEHDRRGMEDKAASTIDEDCTLCGECEPLCPVGAITIEQTVKTDSLACILCNACVKNCPAGARVVADPMINKVVSWVSKNFQDRREPEIFI
ncbi:MAG: 4Fe-4S binding protein [Desulfobacter sp.]|nr:4Fe-4S binding protein [Desulfobacter sp.]